MTRLFLDTSFAVALSSPKDLYHPRAVALARNLERLGSQMVTTRAVILEIGNSLSRLLYRSAGVALLDFLETDPRVEIVPLSENLYRKGFEIFRSRHDKEWSLVDCISFEVMRDRGLVDSLTTDQHFKQASFRALLLEA